MLQISAKEKKIIRDIINIAIAKAAHSFAMVSKEEVSINVPTLNIIDHKKLLKEVDPQKKAKVVIQSEIKGDITGHTLLFFFDQQLDILEKVCLNFNSTKEKIKDLKTSLVLELSNIITGSLVTQLANLLKLNIFGSVPRAPIYPLKKGFKDFNFTEENNSWIVTIRTSFIRSGELISLPFVIVFDLFNMEKILAIIRSSNLKAI